MEIKINGIAADITLESEKTIGEIMAGVQQWLDNTSTTAGIYISGLEIDGKENEHSTLDMAFEYPLDSISSINIKTSTWAELMLMALFELRNDLDYWDTQNKEDRQQNRQRWEQSARAVFLQRQEPNLFQMILAALEERELAISKTDLNGILSERIREIENPSQEISALKPITEEIAKRLEDMPLDMQTGKDLKAAETITLFSGLTEKIFRLIFLFSHFGTDIKSIQLDSINGSEQQSLSGSIEEFKAALKELITAYENKDTVLVGDLAEYELAPRLRSLTSALCNIKYGEKAE